MPDGYARQHVLKDVHRRAVGVESATRRMHLLFVSSVALVTSRAFGEASGAVQLHPSMDAQPDRDMSVLGVVDELTDDAAVAEKLGSSGQNTAETRKSRRGARA